MINTGAGVESKSKAGRRLRLIVPPLLSAIPAVVVPVFEWIPWLNQAWRTGIIIASLLIAAVGLSWLAIRDHKVERALDENKTLRDSLQKAEPEYLLQLVAGPIFGPGAWRLSVYQKLSFGGRTGERLIKLAAISSDGSQAALSSTSMPIQPATLFQSLFLSNLADARYRRADQSGAYEGDLNSADWSSWRNEIFGASEALDQDASSFRARKFAWYAAQEPRSQAVFTVVAESAHAEGIVVEHLEHVLTPPWLFFVAELAGMRTLAEGA